MTRTESKIFRKKVPVPNRLHSSIWHVRRRHALDTSRQGERLLVVGKQR
jgi:hypothetical protein